MKNALSASGISFLRQDDKKVYFSSKADKRNEEKNVQRIGLKIQRTPAVPNLL
jgi:hypothetical protein